MPGTTRISTKFIKAKVTEAGRRETARGRLGVGEEEDRLVAASGEIVIEMPVRCQGKCLAGWLLAWLADWLLPPGWLRLMLRLSLQFGLQLGLVHGPNFGAC